MFCFFLIETARVPVKQWSGEHRLQRRESLSWKCLLAPTIAQIVTPRSAFTIHGCTHVVLFMQSAGKSRVQAGPPSTCVDKIIAALVADFPSGTLRLRLDQRDTQQCTSYLRQGLAVMWSSAGLCFVFFPLMSCHHEVERRSGKFRRTLP